MEELLYLLKLNQLELKRFLYQFLQEKNMSPIVDDGFIYAEGDIPILFVAHMDTVFEDVPKNIIYDEIEDKIYNIFGGLGGDDRCGVYAITRLLENHKPYILFTEDEEIGCLGALKAIEKIKKPDVKYIVEFDRSGKDDCVFYDCGNKEFMEYIKSFGFKEEYGSFTDISKLGSAWDIASVNLSIGYYNQHTTEEYISFEQLINTIKCAEFMIESLKYSPFFNYQEVIYNHVSPFVLSYLLGLDIESDNWSFDFAGTNSKKNTINICDSIESQINTMGYVPSNDIKRLLFTYRNKKKDNR